MGWGLDAMVEMGEPVYAAPNSIYRAGADLVVIQNLVQRVGFQHPVGPDIYFLSVRLFGVRCNTVSRSVMRSG